MKLADLDAKFLKRVDERTHRYVATLAEADGVQFLCPVCFAKNNGPAGTHGVLCWFVGMVPDETLPKPGRWTPQGTGLHDLTFVPGTPPRLNSVLLTGPGCGAHFFVVNGEITFG